MSSEHRGPAAPVGQQGLPTRVAAFDSLRSLRNAREPLLLATGMGYVEPHQTGRRYPERGHRQLKMRLSLPEAPLVAGRRKILARVASLTRPPGV